MRSQPVSFPISSRLFIELSVRFDSLLFAARLDPNRPPSRLPTVNQRCVWGWRQFASRKIVMTRLTARGVDAQEEVSKCRSNQKDGIWTLARHRGMQKP